MTLASSSVSTLSNFVSASALTMPRPTRSTLFPYTTLFRSPNKSGTKMKWEMQDTWDLSKRLARWQRNDDKWNSKPLQASTPKERSEEHTSELQSRENLVCRLLLEKKNSLLGQ